MLECFTYNSNSYIFTGCKHSFNSNYDSNSRGDKWFFRLMCDSQWLLSIQTWSLIHNIFLESYICLLLLEFLVKTLQRLEHSWTQSSSLLWVTQTRRALLVCSHAVGWGWDQKLFHLSDSVLLKYTIINKDDSYQYLFKHSLCCFWKCPYFSHPQRNLVWDLPLLWKFKKSLSFTTPSPLEFPINLHKVDTYFLKH